MKLKWTTKATADVGRLYEFLASVNKAAALRVIQTLMTASEKLQENLRMGERLNAFENEELRRLIVGSYEIRYEILDETIYILRLWHTRETR